MFKFSTMVRQMFASIGRKLRSRYTPDVEMIIYLRISCLFHRTYRILYKYVGITEEVEPDIAMMEVMTHEEKCIYSN